MKQPDELLIGAETSHNLDLRQEQIQVYNTWHNNLDYLLSKGSSNLSLANLENNTRSALIGESGIVGSYTIQNMKSNEPTHFNFNNPKVINLANQRLHILMADPNMADSIGTMEQTYEAQLTELSNEEIVELHRLVGEIVFERYFIPLDEGIPEAEVEAVDIQLGDRLSFYQNNIGQNIKRREAVVIFNGPTGSGKGTAAKKANLMALETGTNGILGQRGEDGARYKRWYLTTRAYEDSMGIAKMFPNKLMRLFLADEAIRMRSQMDKDGEQDIGIAISGYPRTGAQAMALFRNIDPSVVKAVTFNMNEVTGGDRLANRILVNLMSKKEIRADDLFSLDPVYSSDLLNYIHINNFNSFDIIKYYFSDLIEEVRTDNQHLPEEVIEKEVMLQLAIAILQKWRSDSGINTEQSLMAKNTRYYKDIKAQLAVQASLASLGIPTTEIFVDDLTPDEQSARLIEALGRGPLRPTELNIF
jgi:hypothetical protein